MSSKTHVDSTVNERRLRPIYDWLDNGNNKKALQEADKVLRKQPSNQCARVLKALALLRLGKESECQIIMDKVRSEVPCEDITLQAMSICYKEIHQPDKIKEVYEAAAKVDPNNEELLTHLFMAYVRLGDLKGQQLTALALYKLKPKNPYYFWAVMSIVMQAVHADEKLAKGVILPLAERMVLKLFGENKLEAEQEVQLYLMILELQGKDEEVLKVLSGPLAAPLSSVEQRKALLLLRLQRHSEAATAFRQLILQDVDNWAYYKDYLTAALKHENPLDCLDFLNEIGSTTAKRVRAPHLARFQLLQNVGENEELRSKLALVDLMQQYFVQFGEKGCVVGDLKLYLNLLQPAEQLELLQKIEEVVGVGPDEFPKSSGQMQKHIHYEQLRRLCGLHHSPQSDTEKRKLLAKRFCDLYDSGNECCPASERLPTDFSPADSYILMASHLFVQLWFETRDASHLYKAMALLERGLASSPANFHLKIMLVRIYLEAGLAGAADNAYTLLETKQIQLDSLGYLHTPLLAPLGHLSRSATLLDLTAKFFVANYKQCSDLLTFAYKYGSFVKIQEFVELKERLENSLHFAMTTVDKMILELSWCDSTASLFNTLLNMTIQPQEDTIQWELLRDNRDLEVVIGWEPLEQISGDPRMHEETKTCMLRLLSARSLMLRILAATGEFDSSALLSKLATQLRILNDRLIPKDLEKFNVSENDMKKTESVIVPLDAVARLREAQDSDQMSIVASLAESLVRSSRPDADCMDLLRSSPALRTLPLPDSDTVVSYKDYFLRASTCGETLAILTGMCVAWAIQSRQTCKPKARKFSVGTLALTPQEYQTWKEIASLLAERINSLEADLTELSKRQVQTNLPSDDEIAIIVAEKSQDSVSQSCWALKSRVQLTTKLLNGLSLKS